MDLKAAKSVVKQLFRQLGISKVIVVDDAYGRTFSAPDAMGPIVQLIDTEAGLENLDQICGGHVDFGAPGAIWRRQLTAWWEDLSPENRKGIVTNLYAALGDTETVKDIAYASTLSLILNGTIDYEEKTPMDWEKCQEALDQEVAEGKRLLILFDWDLKGKDGTDYLRDAYARYGKRGGALLGLLSGKFPINGERATARQLLDRSVPVSSCLPLSKERLITANGVRFGEGVKLAALNVTIEGLLDEVLKTVVSAAQQADKQLRELFPHDLLHVFENAASEGVWEAGTVIRLLDVYFRDHLREQAEDDAPRAKLNTLVQRVTELSKVPTGETKETQPSDRVVSIRTKELYSPPDLHNRLRTPVRLGDLYEINGVPYILLAQPCDLMIRSGRRLSIVPLVEIRPGKPVSEQAGPPLSAPIEYFRGGDTWYAHYKVVAYVPIELVDMTSFNQDGACSIKLGGAIPFEAGKYVKRRYTDVCKDMARLADSLQLIETYIPEPKKESMRSSFLGQYVAAGLGEPVINDGILTFPALKRVGHYREEMASILLDGFSDVNSRPARPGDFARKKPSKPSPPPEYEI